ncbi:TPA: EscU/YscU/HrcU family type III secretion system export apparatus switch protein [Escherichia coli]
MANKTEKPTQKKLQDASKKGQILKSRDLTISVIMLVGTLYLGYVFDVHHIMSILEYILDHNAKPDIWDYFKAMGVGWLKTNIPFLLVCMFTTILVSWFQSKKQLATEAVKFKLDSLNPVNGLKRIHIAIGIYFKPHLSPIPLISVRETNEVALAVRKYAKEIGIPIITDKKLARKIYATHRRYDYVSFENIDEILRLLLWLEDVENAGQPVPDEQLSSEDKFIEGEEKEIENKDDNLKN